MAFPWKGIRRLRKPLKIRCNSAFNGWWFLSQVPHQSKGNEFTYRNSPGVFSVNFTIWWHTPCTQRHRGDPDVVGSSFKSLSLLLPFPVLVEIKVDLKSDELPPRGCIFLHLCSSLHGKSLHTSGPLQALIWNKERKRVLHFNNYWCNTVSCTHWGRSYSTYHQPCTSCSRQHF